MRQSVRSPRLRLRLIVRLSLTLTLVKKPGSNAWVLTGFYRDSGDRSTGYLDETSTSPSSTSPRHVRGGAESLSPRIENERHALASADYELLGDRLSMESNSSLNFAHCLRPVFFKGQYPLSYAMVGVIPKNGRKGPLPRAQHPVWADSNSAMAIR